jgi:hypothetical protein
LNNMSHTYTLNTQITETVRANQVGCIIFVFMHITWFTCTIPGITSKFEELLVTTQFNHQHNQNEHQVTKRIRASPLEWTQKS